MNSELRKVNQETTKLEIENYIVQPFKTKSHSHPTIAREGDFSRQQYVDNILLRQNHARQHKFLPPTFAVFQTFLCAESWHIPIPEKPSPSAYD